MTLPDEAERIILRRFRREIDLLVDAGGTVTSQAFRRIGSLDESSIARFTEQAGPALNNVSARAGASASGLTAMLTDSPVGVPDVAIPDWRGPYTAGWRALGEGAEFDDAFERAASVAEATGQNAVASTAREAVAASAPAGTTWRRITDGDACDWCIKVAQQIYKSASSANFGHDRCACMVVPSESAANAPGGPSEAAVDMPPEVDVSNLSAAAKRALRVPDEIATEAKKLAPKRPPRVYGVEDADVIAAAQRAGVSADEVLVARKRIGDVKGAMYDAAERVQARTFMDLDRWEALKMRTPPKLTKGSRGKVGDYDFLERLDTSERRRLSRNYYENGGDGPDLIAQRMKQAGVNPGGSDDELIGQWLQTTREYEAAGAIRRGKIPSRNAYSGSIDVDDLIEIEGGYSPTTILGSADDLDVAAHIAAVDREGLADEAIQYLSEAINAIEGPPPFRMSFQSWEDEVRTLEYGLREFPAEMPENARRRLAEIVPQYLDNGQDYEDLYAAIVTKAKQAGLEVPDYVGIPWQ